MAPAAALLLRGVKVLVVDDNETNRRILVGLLSLWEMRVSAVADGERALAQLAAARAANDAYALVLTDLHMPEMDGFGLIERMRRAAAAPAAAIMMLTYGGHAGDLARCAQLGVSAYLIKPVRRDELRKSLCEALEGARPPAAVPVPAGKARAPGAPRPSLHILVAEDNPVNQILLKRLLEKRGHTVKLAANGRLALAGHRGGELRPRLHGRADAGARRFGGGERITRA